MELIDLAQALEATQREQALSRQRKKYTALKDTKQCYNCQEPLNSGLRFCDSDCRDDFDYRVKRGKTNGC